MKVLSLIGMMVTIYILSSISSLDVLDPLSWLNIKAGNFYFDFRSLLSSRFYQLYHFSLDKQMISHKICHFIFFGALALLFLKNLNSIKLAWFLTTLYALTDEIHQFSVPGRNGSFQDVLIDSGAALLWLSIYYLIRKSHFKRNPSRNLRSSH